MTEASGPNLAEMKTSVCEVSRGGGMKVGGEGEPAPPVNREVKITVIYI